MIVAALLTAPAQAGFRPGPLRTPGVANPALTTSVICAKGWSTSKVRDVDINTKHQAYARYGLNRLKPPCPCEVDHLIPLEIGGSNDIKNLWPQSYTTKPWNAHVKDDLENHLHKLVCANKLDQATAQHDIAKDWIAAYRKYYCGGMASCGSSGRATLRKKISK